MTKLSASDLRSHPIALQGRLAALREFKPTDVPDVHCIVGDDRVTRWLSFDARALPETEEMVTGIIARSQAQPRTEFYLAITPCSSRRLVGFVRLDIPRLVGVKRPGSRAGPRCGRRVRARRSPRHT